MTVRVLFIDQQIDYEPQGIMHLSSVLKGAGHEVELAVAAHQDPVAAVALNSARCRHKSQAVTGGIRNP